TSNRPSTQDQRVSSTGFQMCPEAGMTSTSCFRRIAVRIKTGRPICCSTRLALPRTMDESRDSPAAAAWRTKSGSQPYTKSCPRRQHAVHFTPDFSIDERTGQRYAYYNKPFALRHFLQHASPLVNETTIALLDPDMVLLSPVTPYTGPSEVMFSTGHPVDEVRGDEIYWVTRGYPVAQAYMYGGKWALWPDLSEIVPANSPALGLSEAYAAKHYAVGPPLLAHSYDWLLLADKWAELVPGVLERHPGLLSEMQAFSIAAAHLRLPATQARSYMVSDAKVETGAEGWELVEGMAPLDVCRSPTRLVASGRRLPNVLHYCQMYRAGVYMFGKRREELHDVFRCGGPLLLEPPRHAAKLKVRVHPGPRVETVAAATATRNAFGVCVATKAVNEAIADYRQRYCPPVVGKPAPPLRLTDLPPKAIADTKRWKEAEAV
ncbi:unnamed protein product, partial [Phaeothamnion confervicola]